MSDTPKPAPATPAATPMAGNGYETAAVMRDLFREWWDKHDTATKLRTPQEMTAFQRIQNAFYAGALAIMDRQRAVAMNSEAPQNLPAAAQPQRESAMATEDDHGYGSGMSAGIHNRRCVCKKCTGSAQRESEQPERCNFYFGGFDGGNRCQKQKGHDEGHVWESDEWAAWATLSPQTDSQEPR